jgi:RNA polymerase sigma factor (sigma-70 family)
MNELNKALHLALSLPAGQADGRLLELFIASRDEGAFEALVRRHGTMVFGVCRRLLRDHHLAEDAFQAAFLLLARKATSVVKRNSVGGWLYKVAYHIALEAKAASDRRRGRERQVEEMPHPEVQPKDPEDWRPLLDRELARLPEKYRVPVILYHLEGRPHREVAQELGVPEGTLSTRLLTARRLLASRLSRQGVGLSAGALTVALSETAAAGAPHVALVNSTVRAAALLAAGEAALATPAVALMKGALQSMFLKKLKVVAATAVVVLTLGVGGLAYRAGGQTAPAEKPTPKKPLTELEALRRENQLLKLNLEVVLEKVARLEAEVRGLRGKPSGKVQDLVDPTRNFEKGWGDRKAPPTGVEDFKRYPEKDKVDPKRYYDKAPPKDRGDFKRYTEKPPPDDPKGFRRYYDKDPQPKDHELADPKRNFDKAPPNDPKSFRRYYDKGPRPKDVEADPLTQAEKALKALRAAPDPESQRKAANALEKALRSLRGKGKPADGHYYIPDKR